MTQKKIKKHDVEDIYSLTPLQEGMLFHYLKQDYNDSYLVQMVIKLAGQIDFKQFKAAWKQVVEEEPVLRTVFRWKNISSPIQVVIKRVSIDIEEVSENKDIEKELDYILKDERKAGIDISDVPFKIKLIRNNHNKNYFIITNHHILLDGWSNALILKRFISIYSKANDESDNKVIKTNVFKDYVKWLHNKNYIAEKEAWTKYMYGFQSPCFIPRANQCFDKQRVGISEYGTNKFTVSQNTLMKLSHTLNLSIANIIYAAWGILYYKYTGANDIIFGVTVSSRPQEITDINNAIGLFINTLPFRMNISDTNTVKEIIKNAQITSTFCFEHGATPIEKIKDYASIDKKIELFDSIVVIENYPLDSILREEFSGLKIVGAESIENNNYGINLSVKFLNDDILLELLYDKKIYDRDYMHSLMLNFEYILDECVALSDQEIRAMEWLNTKERTRILTNCKLQQKFNLDYEISIKKWLDDIVNKYESNVAAAYLQESITYEELGKRSDFLETMIQVSNIDNTIIAICINKSIDLIIAILSVIKSGAAFLLIDPSLPDNRMEYCLIDSKIRTVISTEPIYNTKSNMFKKLNISYIDVGIEGSAQESKVDIFPKMDDIVYVVYTSGTSGNPKAVMITNRNLAFYMKSYLTLINVNDKDVSLGAVPISFDLFFEELFASLMTGGKFAIPSHQEMTDLNRLRELIIEEKVSLISCAPLLLNEMNKMEPLTNVRYFINGGDVLKYKYIDRLVKYSEVYNGYGPAEATIGAIFSRVKNDNIALGKCLPGYSVLILDRNGKMVPYNHIGEICIMGPGVAKGYFNNEKETAQRFVEAPFFKGEIMYKTGDMGYFTKEGEYYFAGRNDRQIKIRGYRVELLEIEANIQLVNGVSDAAVSTYMNGTQLQLVAYYVGDSTILSSNIEEHIKKVLPEYMVPNYYIRVEQLARTANGKVDLTKLPCPKIRPKKHIAPTTEIEKSIANIWKELLNSSEEIGVGDNYFELGGDSIISMQMAYKLGQAGHNITVNDIFNYPTIKELAQYISRGEVKKNKFDVERDRSMSLTPIQSSFFDEVENDWNHWNQSILLKVSKFVEIKKILKSVKDVFDNCIEFDLRFTERNNKWEQFYSKNHIDTEIDIINLNSSFKEDDSILIDYIDTANKSINIKQGPLFKIYFFVLRDINLLFFTAHHLVIDGVSWRVLLTDIISAFHHQSHIILNNYVPLQVWVNKLTSIVNSNLLEKEADFWSEYLNKDLFHKLDKSRIDKNYEADMDEYVDALSKEMSEALFYSAREYYKVPINILIISSFTKALQIKVNKEMVIDMEGHGRDQLDSKDGIDFSNSIGWFTSIFPFPIMFDLEDNNYIYKVAKSVRLVKEHEISYGIIKYMSELCEHVQFPDSEILFSYLGVVDNIDKDRNEFELINTNLGENRSKQSHNKYIVEVDTAFQEKQLKILFRYNKMCIKESFIQDITQQMIKELIFFTKNPRENYTDFNEINYNDIGVTKSEIQNIYPLTPVQSGMVFHVTFSEESNVAVEQTLLKLKTDCNLSRLEEAWNLVLSRHEGMRATFHFHLGEKWVQAVHKHTSVTIKIINSEKAMMDKADEDSILQRDREIGLNIDVNPLMRVQVYKYQKERYMLWTHHHLLADGWSVGILLQELCEIYESLSNHDVLQKQVIGLKDYFIWLKQYEEERAIEFWRQELFRLSKTTRIVNLLPTKLETYVEAERFREIEQQMSRESYKYLEEKAAKLKVTTSTLVQAAWALTLRYYTQEDQVVFGVTSAGRPIEVENINEIVGCLMNTMPLVVNIDQNDSVSSWVQKIQRKNQDIRKHEYIPLSSIREQLGGDRNSALYDLYESIVIFENYPFNVEILANNSIIESSIKIKEELDYPMTLYCNVRAELSMKILYDSKLFDKLIIEDIFATFMHILTQLDQSSKKVYEVDLVSERESQKLLLVKTNDVQIRPPMKRYFDLFEESVRIYPKKTAIVIENTIISYEQLLCRANVIAHILKDKGISNGSIVPIIINRSWSVIAAMLGVIKIGAAFTLVDAKYPIKRINDIIKQSSAKLLLLLEKNKDIRTYNCPCIMIENNSFESYNNEMNLIECETQSEDLVYVIYTSGSTGEPKGVMVENHALISHIVDINNRYELGDVDVVLQFSELSFDISLEQIFTTLSVGATLVMRDEKMWTPFELLKAVEKHKLSVINLPTAYWNEVVRELENEHIIPASLRLMVVGGERMIPEYASRWMKSKALKEIRLLNAYGPAETVITSAIYEVDPDFNLDGNEIYTPVGHVLANRNVDIVNKGMKVPFGWKGEVMFRGSSIARGYIDNQQLTQKVFRKTDIGERVYLSGDQGRYRKDGMLEIIGRNDEQVKINSYRIEISEVESALMRTGLFLEVAVIVSEKTQDDRELVAFYTSNNTVDMSIVEQHVVYYMIPKHFVRKEVLPKSINGKVDKKQLIYKRECIPNKEYINSNSEYNTVTEKAIMEIWKEVLNTDSIDANSDFFILGGNSLKAMQMMARIRKSMKYEIPLKTIFESPKLLEFCALLDQQKERSNDEIEPVFNSEKYDVTPQQRRIYIALEMNENKLCYNIPFCLRLKGKLDIKKLDKVMQILVDRQSSLRTYFEISNGNIHQKILDSLDYSIEHIKIDKELAVDELYKIADKEFDLGSPPLFRSVLFTVNQELFFLVVVIHHIICDGVSIGYLINAIERLYNADDEVPLCKYRYIDYMNWQKTKLIHSTQYNKAKDFWEKLFKNPPHALNIYRKSGSMDNEKKVGERVKKILDNGLSNRIRFLCIKLNCTPFDLLISSYYILLHQYTLDTDIVVGVPVSGRFNANFDDIVGMFVNTLPLRININVSESFDDLLERVHKFNLEALDIQSYQLESLIDVLDLPRDVSRNPLFDATFIYQNMDVMDLNLNGLSCSNLESDHSNIKYDLSMKIYDDKEFTLFFEYDSNLFEHSMMTQMLLQFEYIVEQVTENIKISINKIEVKREYLSCGIGETNKIDSLEQIIAKCEVKFNDSLSVVDIRGQYTYQEIRDHANIIAAYLLSKGCVSGDLVGIYMSNSVSLISSFLAIMKIGAVILPLDIELPHKRLDYIIADSEVKYILVNEYSINIETPQIEYLWVNNMDINYSKNILFTVDNDTPAYVVYTSGTSGDPKGVVISRNNIVNYYGWLKGEYTVDDKTVLLSAYSYDLSFTTIFACIFCGAQLHLLPREKYLNVDVLLNYLFEHKISIIKITPSFFHEVMQSMDSSRGYLERLRKVIFGGESYYFEDLKELLNLYPHIKVMNHYGPTETTIGVLTYNISSLDGYEKKDTIIGSPLNNTEIKIVDHNNKIVPRYTVGELHVSGESLSLGYYNKNLLNEKSFYVSDNKWWYRTGDFVNMFNNGNVSFIGRVDQQIKIRGYRIELKEIERNIKLFKTITDVSVIVEGTMTRKIIVYFVSQTEIKHDELYLFLQQKLPVYMLPNKLIRVDSIPKLPNGKMDILGLKKIRSVNLIAEKIVDPQNIHQQRILHCWKELLDSKHIGIKDNFFNLGGDSFKAVQLVSMLHDYDISIRDVFKYQTIEQLADFLQVKQVAVNIEIPEIRNCEQENSKRQVVLNKVVPFNDLYYKSCFYNAFFTMANYWKLDPISFMVNETIFYEFKKMQIGHEFKINYSSQSLHLENLEQNYGLEIQGACLCNNFILTTISSLSQNKMIITRVDSFYESNRKDVYNKKHWAHYVLVVGYDQIKECFYIIEHSGINNLDYTCNEISFTELNECYKGYLKNFAQINNSIQTYYAFSRNHMLKKEYDLKQNYYHTLKNNQKLYNGNIDVINEFIIFLKSIIIKNEIQKHFYIIELFVTDMLLCKKAEAYKISKILYDKQIIVTLSNDLVSIITIIKSMILKCKLTNNFSKNPKWIKILELIKEFSVLDKKYYTLLFEFVVKEKY